jgi:hypothetical protein
MGIAEYQDKANDRGLLHMEFDEMTYPNIKIGYRGLWADG